MYELKNRLNKNTKDVTLILKLPNSVAELQLALKLDTVSNEFNHKIYELLRSKLYTPISNLCELNSKWSWAFFMEQENLVTFVKNSSKKIDFEDKLTFESVSPKVKNFITSFLKSEILFNG